jgi:hypothetical protein
MDGPKSMRQSHTFPPPTKCWAQTHVANFHLWDRLLWRLGHIYFQSRQRAKLIWEAYYSRVTGHLGIEKIVAMLQKHFYWSKLRQEVSKYIRSCTSCTISKPATKKKACTPLCLILIGHGNPFQWTTCQASRPPRGAVTVFLWLLIAFLRWQFWPPTRRASQYRPLPRYFERVWVHFGILQTIVSYRDNRFISTF